MIAPRLGYPLVLEQAAPAPPGSRGVTGAVRAAVDRWLLLPAVRGLLGPFSVHGLEHLDALGGPVVFAANHASHLDTLALLAALPESRRRPLRIAAAEDYFYDHRLRRTLVSSALPTYPFTRHGDTTASLRASEELLANGHSLLIFPEGTRSPSGEIGRFKRGVALIAARGGVPVIPVYLDGPHDALPKGARLPRRRATSVSFAAPLLTHHDDCAADFADAVRVEVLAMREARRRSA